MRPLMQVVVAARKLRAEQNVASGQRVSIHVAAESEAARRVLAANEDSLLLLARGHTLVLSDETDSRPAMAELVQCLGGAAVVSIEREVSRDELEEQRRRVERELGRLRDEEAKLAKKLENEQFMSKAPETVKSQAKERRAAAAGRVQALEGQLADLTKSLEG